jgi:hypothetical protein
VVKGAGGAAGIAWPGAENAAVTGEGSAATGGAADSKEGHLDFLLTQSTQDHQHLQTASVADYYKTRTKKSHQKIALIGESHL